MKLEFDRGAWKMRVYGKREIFWLGAIFSRLLWLMWCGLLLAGLDHRTCDLAHFSSQVSN